MWSISIAKDRRYPNIVFYVWSISIAKDRRCCRGRSVARDFGGFSQICIYILGKTSQSSVLVYHKNGP